MWTQKNNAKFWDIIIKNFKEISGKTFYFTQLLELLLIGKQMLEKLLFQQFLVIELLLVSAYSSVAIRSSFIHLLNVLLTFAITQ